MTFAAFILALICAHTEPRAPPVARCGDAETDSQPGHAPASTAPDWTVYRGELAN